MATDFNDPRQHFATTLGPVWPTEARERFCAGERSRSMMLLDQSGQGVRVAGTEKRGIRAPDFTMHGHIAGQDRTTAAERLDNRQIESFGVRRGNQPRRVAITKVDFVVGQILEPQQPFASGCGCAASGGCRSSRGCAAGHAWAVACGRHGG